MRILLVSHGFLPESTGGTEIHTHLLGKALGARHDVAVCTHVTDGRQPEHALLTDTYDGLAVYRLVNNFSWGGGEEYFFFDPGQDAPFERVLDEFRPDVVHLHHLGGGLSTTFPGLVQRRGIPVLLTLHDFWPMCYRSHLLTTEGALCPGPEDGLRCARCWEGEARTGGLRQRLRELGPATAVRIAPRALLRAVGRRLFPPPEGYQTTRLMVRDQYFRRLLGRLDLLIAPSRFLLGRYVAWGVPAERLRFVQNGVDAARFAGLRRALPSVDPSEALRAGLTAGYVGSLLPHKGLDVLVDAMNALAGASVRLRIYGRTEGPESLTRYVRSLRARLRNPAVTFEGPFPPEQIGRVLSGLDVLVVPSVLYENCPTAILEALYAGRPVVTSDVGGMAELVQDGMNGLTTPVGSAPDLARALRSLATDRDRLLALQGGIVPPRTMEDVAVEVEGLYEEALRGTSGGERGA